MPGAVRSVDGNDHAGGIIQLEEPGSSFRPEGPLGSRLRVPWGRRRPRLTRRSAGRAPLTVGKGSPATQEGKEPGTRDIEEVTGDLIERRAEFAAEGVHKSRP